MYVQSKLQATLQPFIIVSKNFLYHLVRWPELLAAYLILLEHCRSDQPFCWPSQERLANLMNCSVRAVRNRLERLEALGYIRTEKKGTQNTYRLEHPDVPVLLPPPTKVSQNRISDPPRNRTSMSPNTGSELPLNTGSRLPVEVEQREQEKKEQHSPPHPPVVVFSEDLNQNPKASSPSKIQTHSTLDSQTEARLKTLGVRFNQSVIACIGQRTSDAVEQALACLEAAKNVNNPTGYFLAALKGNWLPPASFVEAKAKKERERTELLARIQEAKQALADWLAKDKSPEALDREADGCLNAEQDRRRLFRRSELQGDELERRRAYWKAHVTRYWQEEETSRRRAVEQLAWELNSKKWC